MHARSDRLELLDDEAPAGRRFQPDFKVLAAEARGEHTHAGAVGRSHAAARHLAGVGVQPVGGDLCSVLSSPITIVARGLLTLHYPKTRARTSAAG